MSIHLDSSTQPIVLRTRSAIARLAASTKPGEACFERVGARRAPLSTVFLILVMGAALIVLYPGDASAYVDPGTTGMLSQALYVLFYGALGLFLYLLRYIKQYFAGAKQFIAKLLGWGS